MESGLEEHRSFSAYGCKSFLSTKGYEDLLLPQQHCPYWRVVYSEYIKLNRAAMIGGLID